MATNIRIATTSARLKEAMYAVNKTPADLARDTGLNKSTLSRYLSGAIEPKQHAIAKLAFVLGVSEMWLWGYDVPMVKKETAPEDGLSDAKRKLIALAENCSEEDAENLLKMMELALRMR
jgi:repressor LexA